MFQTSNPVFRHGPLAQGHDGGIMAQLNPAMASARSDTMTFAGTITKTSILLVLCSVSASVIWGAVRGGDVTPTTGIMIGLGGTIAGLVLSLVMLFRPMTARVLAPIHALCEGLFLGVISLIYASKFGAAARPGAGGVSELLSAGGGVLVFQAVLLTFSIAGALLLTYAMGLVRLNNTAIRCITIATGGVMILYLVNMLMSAFGTRIPFIHETGPLGIAFSLFVVVLASLNLVRDFQNVEHAVDAGAPKAMEWYAGYGILVGLIWLYLEVLRLLSKIKER